MIVRDRRLLQVRIEKELARGHEARESEVNRLLDRRWNQALTEPELVLQVEMAPPELELLVMVKVL